MERFPESRSKAALSRRKRFWFRFALLLFGIGVPLAVFEVGLRFMAFRADAAAAAAWQEVGVAVPEDGRASLVHIIRPCPNDRLVYELRPDLDVTYEGARLTTNAVGLRSPDVATGKRAGTFRIVGIGDSGMFGSGVRDEDNFLAVTQRRLNAELRDEPFEFVNTGVPGYNTTMEVETLVVKGLAYEPDLVVVDFCGNDLDLPNFISAAEDYWTLSRSFVFEWGARVINGVDRITPNPLVGAPHHRDLFRRENDPDRVPPRYRDMVGIPAYRRAMRRLAALAREHDFPVVVTCHTRAPDYVREICDELGFPVLDAAPRVEAYMREHGIARYLGSELSVSATDPHGSAITHGLMADMLLEHLRAEPRVRAFCERF